MKVNYPVVLGVSDEKIAKWNQLLTEFRLTSVAKPGNRKVELTKVLDFIGLMNFLKIQPLKVNLREVEERVKKTVEYFQNYKLKDGKEFGRRNYFFSIKLASNTGGGQKDNFEFTDLLKEVFEAINRQGLLFSKSSNSKSSLNAALSVYLEILRSLRPSTELSERQVYLLAAYISHNYIHPLHGVDNEDPDSFVRTIKSFFEYQEKLKKRRKKDAG